MVEAPFDGRVAVVTGAASGLGAGLAHEAARLGMRLVLADVDEAGLQATASSARARGAPVIVERCDVTRGEDLERLAASAVRHFGGTDLLFSNAGVTLERPLWAYTEKDWQWVLGVNLWGVIHGVRAFVPRMLDRTGARVVNVASVAGLTPLTGLGAYNASKHAVVALTETLHHDLLAQGAKLRCSVLCPGRIETAIEQAQRHRPAALTDEGGPVPQQPHRFSPASSTAAMTPEQAAQITFEALRQGRFHILTHPRVKRSVQMRTEHFLDDRDPRDPYSL